MKLRQLGLAILGATLISACDAPSNHGQTPDLTKPLKSEATTLYFVNLHDGQHVKSPFRVIFGLSGMGIAPAGVEHPNTGHHHLLIDTTLSEEELDFAIVKDDQHRHFGGGQTEAVISLEPGTHSLQLVLGDQNHEVLKPPLMSDVSTITVE